MDNQVSSYFQKRWPFSNTNRAKNNMNTRKVNRHRNSNTKAGNREPQQNYGLGTICNELLGRELKHVLQCQPRPQFPKWYKILIISIIRKSVVAHSEVHIYCSIIYMHIYKYHKGRLNETNIIQTSFW